MLCAFLLGIDSEEDTTNYLIIGSESALVVPLTSSIAHG